jgi:UDP-2,3-diacylglucosamine pyrophosphatase LpxH
MSALPNAIAAARSTAVPAVRPTGVSPVESEAAGETPAVRTGQRPALRLKNVRVVRAPLARHVRTAWISDVHLGTRSSNAAALLEFLREHEIETLYVVGDLIDVWQLRRAVYWPQQHNDVIQKILRKARKGTRVVYIPGNHDEYVSGFLGQYGNIAIEKQAIHRTADGRRMLVIHGHELDTVVQNVRWLAFAGDVGYQFLLSLNPAINFVRRRLGFGYWSLSAYVKKRVKDAVSFIGEFEKAIVRYAEDYRVDAVLCGHIHSAAIRQFGAVTYYNCGDWVESCTALVEREDGTIELVSYRPFQTVGAEPNGVSENLAMSA